MGTEMAEDETRRSFEGSSSREKTVLSLFERFLEWRRTSYPNLWNKATDTRIIYKDGVYVLSVFRVGEWRDLTWSSTRNDLVSKIAAATKKWTGCDTLEEVDLFLSSAGF